jgi:hypothetical protein
VKQCPYCLASIPDEARKCQYCGEWVERPPALETERLRDPITRGIKWYIGFRLVMFALGLALLLAFVFLFFLPQLNRFKTPEFRPNEQRQRR